jgi:monovalent cation:proton antiporter-2 (CPA2) family protein
MNEAEAAAAGAILVDGALMLGAALFFVTIFRRLGLGATLGYIVGGAVIGPYVLGLVSEPEAVSSISEIGIALLLFIVGLELNPSRLWRLKRDIFGLGLIQVLLCGAALSLLIRYALNFSIEASIALGLPLALSSTAQVLPMLRATNQLNHPRGERAFSVLLFQDLSIVPMITVIAAMSRAPADPSAPAGGVLVLYAVGAIVGLVAVGHFVLNPLFRLIGRFGERELFIVAGLFAVIASAALMESLHLSTALGAFIAGVMLAESPYRHELESDVEPFRSILLGLFFLTVGMMLDLPAVAAQPVLAFGLAASIIAIKALLIAAIAFMFGMKKGRAIWLGLLLSQAGEFGFVLFGQAAAAMLVEPKTASFFSAIVTISMISTPFLMQVVEWVLRRIPEPDVDLDGPDSSPETNAIVVGYGRFGQTVAQMLMAKQIPVTIIDSKPSQIELAQEFGTKVYYGDGTRIDLLRTAGADTAEGIIFCQNPNALTRDKLEAVFEAFPHAAIMARVYDRLQVIEFDGLDLAACQREIYESAVALGREALVKLGVPRREAERVEREYRDRDLERLEAQTVTGDLHAKSERSFGVDRPLPDEATEAG